MSKYSYVKIKTPKSCEECPFDFYGTVVGLSDDSEHRCVLLYKCTEDVVKLPECPLKECEDEK